MISLIEKNVLAIFLNGPISKNSFLISKIFNNKVMVIIFILIGIYHLYLNMSPIIHNKIHFLFFCNFFKNSIFSKFSILNVDKNQKHFNPHFKYEDFKKTVENLIWTRFVQINHKWFSIYLNFLRANLWGEVEVDFFHQNREI